MAIVSTAYAIHLVLGLSLMDANPEIFNT